jgi:hypothetical protein
MLHPSPRDELRQRGGGLSRTSASDRAERDEDSLRFDGG